MMRNTIAILWAAASLSVAHETSAREVSSLALRLFEGADIVIVGELHGNEAHHDTQAQVARDIKPSALVFEMLSPAQADAGNAASRDDQTVLDAALGWSDSPWPEFSLYFPIFSAAPEAKIYGAAVARPQVRASVETGAAAQFEGDAVAFGLDQPIDKTEKSTREAGQAAAHCNALPEDLLPGMVEAQRLRDASFARTALQALQDTGGPVLVITGNGHARNDWGMPRYLNRKAPEITVVSVGQLSQSADAQPFDYWVITGDYTPSGGDPCAAFKSK
jgi:uncharacterized iron-regulated protein